MAYDRQRQVALAQTRQSMISTLKHYESDSKTGHVRFLQHNLGVNPKWLAHGQNGAIDPERSMSASAVANVKAQINQFSRTTRDFARKR